MHGDGHVAKLAIDCSGKRFKSRREKGRREGVSAGIQKALLGAGMGAARRARLDASGQSA